MDTYDIGEAEARLIELVGSAAEGRAIAIAKAGKPMVTLISYVETPPVTRPRLGTLEGPIDIPDDFDEIGREDIERRFYGEAEG